MKRLLTPYIYILFFLCNILLLNAQDFTLKILVNDSVKNPLTNELKFKKKHKTAQSIFATIDSLGLLFENYGYFNHQLDSLNNKDSIYAAYFSLGKSTKRIRIFYNDSLVSKKDIFRFTGKVTDTYIDIAIEETPKLLTQLVQLFEEQGRSFTTIKLKNILFRQDHLEATLNINTSRPRTIDKIIVRGYENFPRTFLNHFFKLDKTTLFSTNKVDRLSEKLKAFAFCIRIKTPGGLVH